MKIDKKIVVENILKSKELMMFNINQSDKTSVSSTLVELKKIISKGGDYQLTLTKL